MTRDNGDDRAPIRQQPIIDIGQTLSSGIFGGIVAGFLLGIATLFYQNAIPDGGLDFLSNAGLWGCTGSVVLFTFAHACFGAVFGGLLGVTSTLSRRRIWRWLPASIVFSFSVGFYLTAYVFVAKNLALPANVSLHDPVRSAVLRSSILFGVASVAVAFAVAVFVFPRVVFIVKERVVWVALLGIAIACAINLLHWNSSGVQYVKRDLDSTQTGTSDGKVIVIGIDGASWQLLDTFSEDGLLPNLDRLRSSGASANLVTHGQRLSPAVWTGVATGWSHSEHGILSFMVPDSATGSVRSVESRDRLKPAIWQICSEFGKRPVVLNWYASYPAETVEGVVVSRLLDLDQHAVHPTDLLPRVKAVIDSAESGLGDSGDAIAGVNGIFDLAEKAVEDWEPDLLMLYVPWTDWHQHIYWAALEPDEYGGEWALSDGQIREGSTRLKRLWAEVDRRVGKLLEKAEEDTSVIVISDHGFKPRSKILAYLRPNDLLEAMGYLQFVDNEEGVIDFENTRAFSGQADTYEGMLRIAVNVVGRQENGTVPPESRLSVANELVSRLSALSVNETGEPLFLKVGLASAITESQETVQGFDIFAELGAAVRTAADDRTVVIAQEEHRLDDFLTVMRDNSGNHSPRGVFIGAGPAFRKAAIIPLVADSPFTDALTYVTGYIKSSEGFYRTLRSLGALDPYTTIDITPTILYLFSLPLSSEMEGGLMSRVLSPDLTENRPAQMIDSYGFLDPHLSPERVGSESKETLEKLKALGYIQ